MKGKQSDSDLVLMFQSGDKNALNQLVKRWHKTFCEKAYWMVKDPDVAKDIAQDTWTLIIGKINHLNKPSSFKSWALRIVYTKSLDWINANKKLNNNLENYKCKDVDSSEVQNSNDLIKLKLLEAIKLLPENQQTVIRLFYSQEYSLKEISKILNISVGTAKSRLFHAREKLKQILKNINYEN